MVQDLELKIVIEWYLRANDEKRKQFLDAIQGYPVSEQTWYVHPNYDEETDSKIKQYLMENYV